MQNGSNGGRTAGPLSTVVSGLTRQFYADGVKAAMRHGLDAFAKVPDDMLLPVVRAKFAQHIRYPDAVDFLVKLVAELKLRFDGLHPNVRRRFAENLFAHTFLLHHEERRAIIVRMGHVPRIMVISPTMRCNLACTGCYSANYSRHDAIDTAAFDRVITEAKAMGVYFVVVSGGEPYIRKDLLDIFERHSDVLFMTYTNGTVIYDRNLAPRLAELGNVLPAISVEGFDEETNSRRGRGVFKKIIGAMTQLRNEGVLFGFSATPMRHNSELLVSDEFCSFYENLGAFFGWYFSYMPVGRDPDLALMPTPQQREHRFRRIRELRRTRHMLLSDFWCDGALTGGCLSGGRVYFHINADGGVEPCVFHQFYVDNVLDTPLAEALDSEYFRFVRENLTHIENPLTPCPVIDHPEILRACHQRFHPSASQSGGDKTVTELATGLDQYSAELHRRFDPLWKRVRPIGYQRKPLVHIGPPPGH